MGAGGHIPVRTCVVCGRKRHQSELLRLALDQEQWITVDHHLCMGGRGAYACPSCLPRLRMANRLKKAFRHQARGIAKNILQPSTAPPSKGTGSDFEERGPQDVMHNQ